MLWRNFSKNFLHILVLSLRFLEFTLKISSLSQTLSLKASSNENGPTEEERIPGRSRSQKASRWLLGAQCLRTLIRPHFDVHVGEEHSSPTTAPEAGTNGYETQLPAEGLLLQMLASIQRQLEQ